jgi:hypothetical protein
MKHWCKSFSRLGSQKSITFIHKPHNKALLTDERRASAVLEAQQDSHAPRG